MQAHSHRRLRLSDLLAQTAVCALAFAVMVSGRDLKNIWLIQTGALVAGTALWIPMFRGLSVGRMHLFSAYFCWWIVLSWFLTFAVWQSAFGRDFWAPQIIAISDVGYALCRFVLLPATLAVIALGLLQVTTKCSVWTHCVSAVGCVPLLASSTMEAVGLIQW